jgi:outer membrane beta-barrel protein
MPLTWEGAVHRALLVSLALLPTWAAAQVDDVENPRQIAAVQERTLRMQHEFAVGVGALPVDPFTKGYCAQAGYTVHFTDSFAWQVGRGAYCTSMNTPLRQQLERDFGVSPAQFDKINFYAGSDLLWKPLYGKFAVLNQWVLYGEAYVIIGASLFRFSAAFRPAANVGGGVRVFANKHVSFRVEFTDQVVIPTGRGNTTGVSQVMAVNLGLAFNIGGAE